MPSIEIYLKKIQHNAKTLKALLNSKGLSMMAVTKCVLGNHIIAKALVDVGVQYLADSRIENIINMKNSGIDATFVLIRNPFLEKIKDIVEYADISLNSEVDTIRMLSEEAIRQHKRHGIILMVEMGDLREGIMTQDLEKTIQEILSLQGIKLIGLGTNLKCFAGVIPDEAKMDEFSYIAEEIQEKYNLKFEIVSGGNSSNYKWIISSKNRGLINNLRLGESILLGREGINSEPIVGLFQDTFTLVGEIIELKKKPFYPEGIMAMDGFGEASYFKRNPKLKKLKGNRNHALLNIGRQDTLYTGLKPQDIDLEILGATSDYLIVDLKTNESLKLEDKIKFHVNF